MDNDKLRLIDGRVEMDGFDVFGRQQTQQHVLESQFEQHPLQSFQLEQQQIQTSHPDHHIQDNSQQRGQVSERECLQNQQVSTQAPLLTTLTLFQFQQPIQSQPSQPIQLQHQNQQQQLPHLLQFSNQPDYESIFGLDQFEIGPNQNQEYYKREFESEDQGEKSDNLVQAVSFSMPGAFKTDNMDLDESPPFTIDLGLYVEPTIVSNEKSSFTKQNFANLKIEASLSPFDDSSRVSSYSNVNYDNIINSSNQNENFFNGNAPENMNNELVDQYYQNGNIRNIPQVPRNHSFSNASLNVNNNNLYNELSPLTTTTSLTPSVGSVHSTQPSFFSANQYITRNSLEQPPSSLHRQSFDYYSKTRASMDSQQSSQHQRNQTSGRYTSFTNSITNMLPFIGDRNQRSPVSGPPSPKPPISTHPQSPQQASHQQSRHLIRSIFKSSINNANSNDLNLDQENQNMGAYAQNNENGVFENDDQFDHQEDHDVLMSPVKDETDYDAMDNSLPIKKAKRSKRSLFTRFKAPVKHEPDESDLSRVSDEVQNQNQKTLVDNESLENSMVGNVSLQTSSISRTPSTVTNNNFNNLDTTSLNNSYTGNSHSQSQSQLQLQGQGQGQSLPEPDYAALFENVGKRKHIVNTSSYRKTKTKVKSEMDGHEKSSILGLGSKPKIKIESEDLNVFNEGSLLNGNSINSDRISESDSLSASSSNVSSLQNRGAEGYAESVERESTSSSLASASKRILGSKLTSKKKPPTQNTIPAVTMISKGVEVEVDLESLDLPPNTQIFPTSIINSKNRTRGRKENKEADLLDSSKIYLCNYCSRRFKRQEHLKRHFRSLHTLEKPYDCTICQKKFSRSDNLNQHLKTHKLEEEMANRLAQESESGMNLDVLKEES